MLQDDAFVTLPAQFFLRHVGGDPIGPVPLRAVEALYDARVVDRTTPISGDGADFAPLGEWGELFTHVEQVKERLGAGDDVWSSNAPATADLVADDSVPLLRAMLENAVQQMNGHFRLTAADGTLEMTYKEGKIVAVETSIESLSLAQFLVAEGVCDEATVRQGQERAPAMGGDLGGALISLGAVQPHVYFEKFVAWATKALGGALAIRFLDREFEETEVATPPVPLGFDRLGVLLESVRSGLSRQQLEERLMPNRGCPVIVSQVEGVEMETCKLKPKELRVVNQVNGVKTFGEILEDLGGKSDDKALPVLRAIYFATECGFLVFGEDLQRRKDLAAAEKINQIYDRLERKNSFEIFQISEKASDEEVRTKYTDYAKKYHPDRLPAGAAEELRDAHERVFALISEAFEAIETEELRYNYMAAIDRGEAGGTDDLVKVQNTLHAETLFKKAEILVKVRKYGEAMEHLQEALALNPDDSEFKIHAAYVGYLLQAKGGGDAQAAAEAAARKILTIMKTDANIASGYLLLGHLHKALAKAELAVKYYEKVLEYDPHNQEATREVRLHNMRKQKKKKGLFGL